MLTAEQAKLYEQLVKDYAILSTDVPLLLLPIRLETRYKLDDDPAVLQVRIYPDDIHADDYCVE